VFIVTEQKNKKIGGGIRRRLQSIERDQGRRGRLQSIERKGGDNERVISNLVGKERIRKNCNLITAREEQRNLQTIHMGR
jgi:hypothetical protein